MSETTNLTRTEYKTLTAAGGFDGILTREAVDGWRLVSTTPGVYSDRLGFQPVGVTLFLERVVEMPDEATPGPARANADARANAEQQRQNQTEPVERRGRGRPPKNRD